MTSTPKAGRRARSDAPRRPALRPPRDMDESPFAAILENFRSSVPGAFGAALVDHEGETVDYAGEADPFELRVAAAHMRILLSELGRFGHLGQPLWLLIRGAKRTLLARLLHDGYALVVLLRRRAGFTASGRAFAVCERALAAEAGWPMEAAPTAWRIVTCETDSRGRPVALCLPKSERYVRVEVEVLGRVMGLPRPERGFRVRTANGLEMTVVREARNCWYADAPWENVESMRDAGENP